MNAQNKQGNWLTNLWDGLAEFMHRANLIIPAVIVSVYHYQGALQQHDPWYIALPIALFVDLLHFRAVSRSVKQRKIGWYFAAAVTTGIAFALQLFFYLPGIGQAERLAGWVIFKGIVYASIVPIGIAIMATLRESHIKDAETAVINEEAVRAANRAAADAKQRETEAKQEATKAEELATAANQAATEAKQKAARMQQELNRMQQEIDKSKQLINAGQLHLEYWNHLNDKTKQTLLYMAGHHATLEKAATAANCNKSTLSKHKATLNGS